MDSDYLAMDDIADRRASERHSCDTVAAISYFNQTPSYDARLLNYGAGGMCFRSNLFLRPGTTVCIRVKECRSFGSLKDKGDGLRCLSLAEVKWCHELTGAESAAYGVGVKYQAPAY